ncbi:MAG: cyclodeaminase/cyclohydrolase family protein [Actinomycetota bacterium]
MSELAPIGEQRIDRWLEELGSGAATPGGGAFAALSAAAGAALVSMVGRLTIGKPKFAEAEARMQEIVAEADRERVDLLGFADRDAQAFDAVMFAYRMPRETEAEQTQRLHALQTALERAAEVPLMVARRAVYVMGLAEEATMIGNPNAASDGMCAAAGLHAAAVAALANVQINAFAFVDGSKREALLDDCRRLRDRAGQVLADVHEVFEERVGS